MAPDPAAAIALAKVGAVLGGRPVLSEVSLTVRPGELVALVGPNGAGKSTLIRIAAGLVAPGSGEAYLGGDVAHRSSPSARAKRLAYLPQARPLAWGISVEALVALGRHALPRNDQAVEQALSACGLLDLRHRRADTLSGGELARAHLARALAAEAPALIADEPTAALDPRHALGVMQILADRAASGAAVLAAVHDLSLAARFATRVAVLHEGRLVADAAPKEALTQGLLAAAFGVQGGLSSDGRQVIIEGLTGTPPA